MIAARLTGRCANGAERDGGRRWHALTAYSVFGKALCGAQPGRRSAGWDWSSVRMEVTCPKCLKRTERMNALAWRAGLK
jgi:hypothetical protein